MDTQSPVIGLIDSLNGMAPTLGLESHFPVKTGMPSQLLSWLLEGDIAAGFVPVVCALELGEQVKPLPYCIASKGKVRSVVLFGNEGEDPAKAEKIYLDPRSRTSNKLVRHLLGQRHYEFHDGTPSLLESLNPGEAALFIGDEALRLSLQGRPGLDIAEAWFKKTGYPVSFARLVIRPEAFNETQLNLLITEIEKNLWRLEENAAALGERYGFSEAESRDYLTQNIHYFVDSEIQHGLTQQAAALRLPAPIQRTTKRHYSQMAYELSQGRRLSLSDAHVLAAEAPLEELANLATTMRRRHNPGDGISYIIERNINYTNVCNVFCRFCAFYKGPGRGGYVLNEEQLTKKLDELVAAGGVQVLLQGGVNPDLKLPYYKELFGFIKTGWPVAIHGLSADEVMGISEFENKPVREVLEHLVDYGLDSLPGAGAEILARGVRRKIAKLKSGPDEWLGVMREAHRLGLKSSATMMYGVGETWQDRLIHLERLRELQDSTGGFMAFITWPYQQGDLKLKSSSQGAEEYLRTQAISRIFLDNFPHIQSSWVTMGPTVAQVALSFGADDFGSVMFEENVVSAAGTTWCMNENGMRRAIEEAGFKPIKRGKNYQLLEAS